MHPPQVRESTRDLGAPNTVRTRAAVELLGEVIKRGGRYSDLLRLVRTLATILEPTPLGSPPYSLQPTAYSLQPIPYTLRSPHFSLSPEPYTLNPKP